jgi:hypothetical protein
MQAYEFYATPKDGVIQIPEQYMNSITKGVKVILLEQQLAVSHKEVGKRSKSDLLLPPTARTKGWRFNREEANER